MFIVTICKPWICQYASGWDKLDGNSRLLPSPSLGPASSTFASLEGVPGAAVIHRREQPQGHADLNGGGLVSPSLRTIDQDAPNVQRGERIQMLWCTWGSPSRLEWCRRPFSLTTRSGLGFSPLHHGSTTQPCLNIQSLNELRTGLPHPKVSTSTQHHGIFAKEPFQHPEIAVALEDPHLHQHHHINTHVGFAS